MKRRDEPPPNRRRGERENKLWSYVAGTKRVNRIRVYARSDTPTIWIEWHDDTGRHREPLTTPAGRPITSRALAVKIADRAASAQLTKREASAAHELLGVPKRHTLGELFQRLHDAREKAWSEPYQRDQKRFRKFWLAALGKPTPLARVTPAAAEEKVRAGAEAEGWSARTQRAYLRYLVDAFSYAQRKLKWINEEKNLSAVEMPKGESESKPYSRDEALRLLPATREVDPRCWACAEIAYQTQRRLNAIRSLTVAAYRTEAQKGVAIGVLQFEGKTDKARKTGQAVITGEAKEAVEYLLEQPAVRASGLLFPAGDLADAEAPAVRVSREQLIDWLHEAEKRAGVPLVEGRAYHGLKRRGVADAGRAIRDTAVVSKQSGTTKATLDRIYDQDDLEPKAELAIAMQEQRERANREK